MVLLLVFRKLLVNNSNLVLISFNLIQLGFISNQSSFAKLIRMICIVLCFYIRSNWVAISWNKSLRIICSVEISLAQSNVFSSWSYNKFKLHVTIRLEKILECVSISIAYLASVSFIQSRFNQVSVLANPYRAVISFVCGTHVCIICFGLSSVSILYGVYKRIKPSGSTRMSLIRAAIAAN